MSSNLAGRRFQSRNFKIVLLGKGCVGKTSLVVRYVENKFNQQHQSTLQASYLNKIINVDGDRIKLSIWDTAGQERFHALGPIYYRDSNGAIVVYDVTDNDSLAKAKIWIKELRSILGNNVCIALVGNKTDLIHESKNELIEEAERYNHLLGNAVHYCTSAKANRGLDEMFLDLTRRMVETQKQKLRDDPKMNARNKMSGPNRTLRIAEDDDDENQLNDNVASNKCSC